ncbi:methyl-accepting chemotaxis protein [Paenibacillus nanensis]|nr:methyl-accepting chemotaxis protein [Paenibacillus nanensis]
MKLKFRMTIGKKLSAGCFIIVLLIIVMGAVVNAKMITIGEHAKAIQTVSLPSVQLLGEMKADLIDIERLALRYIKESDTAEKAELETRMNETIEHLMAVQSEYESLIEGDEQQASFNSLLEQEQVMGALTAELTQAGNNNDSAAVERVMGELEEPFEATQQLIHQLLEAAGAESAAALDDTMMLYDLSLKDTQWLTIAAIAAGVIISVIMTRMIARPIVRLSSAAKRIAGGDLTVDVVQVKGNDELRDLAAAFQDMAANLRSLIRTVDSKASQVAGSAQELSVSSEYIRSATEHIAGTVERVAEGSERQSRSIEESSAAVREMAAGMRHIAANAEGATTLAVQASSLAADGRHTIVATVKQMSAISDTVGGLAASIQGLSERSENIEHIVAVITEIASQTNLLALNAAIEAARVGEHGQGFAVVAHEVRKLAERSAESAKQISELAGTIRSETKQVVQWMEAGSEEVTAGIQSVHQAGYAFEQIQQAVDEVKDGIQEVTAATEQMSASTDQVAQSFEVISTIAETTFKETEQVTSSVQEQLSSMEQITSFTADLAEMSAELQGEIGRFRA